MAPTDCLFNSDLVSHECFAHCHFVMKLLCHASKDALPACNTRSCAADYTLRVVLVEWAMLYGLTAEMAFNAAVRGGHLEVVTFFVSEYKWPAPNYLVLEYHKCSLAAGGGHLGCLEYLHEHGCPWNESTCHWAARGGHLECLKYAHEHGCPWNEDTCRAAAQNGHTECLKYAHEHGCPWDERTCIKAVQNGHDDCLKYARDNGWSSFLTIFYL
jgi:hypothetical protein